MDNPPDWAIERACALLNAVSKGQYDDTWYPCDVTDTSTGVAQFARYIAAHEEPPVDPLLIEARKICALTRQTYDKGFLSGEYDDSSTEIPVALAALRRGIEIERERSK